MLCRDRICAPQGAVLPVGEGPVRTATGVGEPADVAVDPRTAWLPGHGPPGGLVQLDVGSLQVTRRGWP